MAVHSENAAAPGRVVSARFPLREVVTIIGVVFTATSALIVGMQWAISNNLGPLFLAMRSIESHVLSTRKEVNVLHADVAVLRGEVGGLRTEVEALRGLPGELPVFAARSESSAASSEGFAPTSESFAPRSRRTAARSRIFASA